MANKYKQKQKFVVTTVVTVENNDPERRPITKKEVRNAFLEGALAFDYELGYQATKISVRSVDED